MATKSNSLSQMMMWSKCRCWWKWVTMTNTMEPRADATTRSGFQTFGHRLLCHHLLCHHLVCHQLFCHCLVSHHMVRTSPALSSPSLSSPALSSPGSDFTCFGHQLVCHHMPSYVITCQNLASGCSSVTSLVFTWSSPSRILLCGAKTRQSKICVKGLERLPNFYQNIYGLFEC